MPKKIRAIFDTSSIIFLDHLSYLAAVETLHDVVITSDVAWELKQHDSATGSGVFALTGLEQLNPEPSFLDLVAKESNLDLGESSVIALGLELGLLLVLDDNAARRFALNKGLQITGTLGVLLKIHKQGLAVRSLEEDLALLSEFGMFISNDLKLKVLASL